MSVTAPPLPVEGTADGMERARRASEPPGPAPRVVTRTDRVALRVFLAVWLIWGGLLIGIRVHYPGLEMGFSYNDAVILNASRSFVEHGLWLTKGLPRLETDYQAGDRVRIYSTYPPGPFWVHEALRAMGISSLAAFRVVAIAGAQAAVLFFFFAARRVTRSVAVAALSASLYMLSAPYAAFCAGMHGENLGQLSLFGTLAAWMRVEAATAPAERRRWVLWTAIVFFLDFWITLQNAMLVAVFIGARLLAQRRWSLIPAACVVGLMPVVGAATRVAHNAWALGGWNHAIKDLASRAMLRSGMTGASPEQSFLLPSYLVRLGWPWAKVPSPDYDRLYMFPVLSPPALAAMIALMGALLALWRLPRMRPCRRGALNGLLLTIGGATWLAAMPQHAYAHRFITLMLMPGLAMFCAALVWTGCSMRPPVGRRLRVGAWALPAIGVVLVGALVSQLRRSDTLNRAVRLDRAIHDRVAFQARTLSLTLGAGAHLQTVKRLVTYPEDPSLGYCLGVPFVVSYDPPTQPLRPGEALATDFWFESRLRLSTEFTDRYGLPEFVSPPARIMLFRSAPQTKVSIRVGDSFEITDLRWSPALDKGHFVLVLGLKGAFSDAMADRYIFGIQMNDASGKRVSAGNTRLSWFRAFDRARALAWICLPKDAISGSTSMEITVWDTAGNRFAPLSAERLAPGMNPSEDGTIIRWPLDLAGGRGQAD